MKTFFTKALPFIAASLVTTGCAVQNDRTEVGMGLSYHSNVTENADGSYYAEVEAALFRGRVGGAEALVTKDAVDKCNGLGKSMKIIKKETESHFLINGVARLTFSCN